jgi:hypothetical protein
MAGLLKHPLAAGDAAGTAGIELNGLAQGPGEGLEAGFDDVV